MPAPRGAKWETDIEERILHLEQRRPLSNTGFSMDGPKAVTFDGDLNVTGLMKGSGFDGDLDAGDAGSAGWAMDGDRAAFGELILRPGSIGNDSLTDPVKFNVVRADTTNFGLVAGTMVEKASTSITVPAGFTEANVAAFAKMYCRNPNTTGGADGAGTDALYVRPNVAGNTPISTPTGVSGSGGFATAVNFDSFPLVGLTSGSTIHIGVEGASAVAAIAADPNNYISLVATVSWLR